MPGSLFLWVAILSPLPSSAKGQAGDPGDGRPSRHGPALPSTGRETAWTRPEVDLRYATRLGVNHPGNNVRSTPERHHPQQCLSGHGSAWRRAGPQA